MKKILSLFLLLICLSYVVGCQKKQEAPTPEQGGGPKKLTVITTLFPLYDFTRNVAGDKANVSLLLPPGVEPHNFEPKPNDIVNLNKADVIVYTDPYMEPWAVKLLGSLAKKPEVVDSSKGVAMRKASAAEIDHHEQGVASGHRVAGGVDPHIWLDFGNAQIMVDNIAKGLAAKDPANKDYYEKNAAAYKAQLQKLDDDFRAGLGACGKRFFLHGGHYTFGYLAARYGLSYRSAQALNPDAEATPDKLALLVKLMRENHLKYVYSEELLSPATAEMLARETNAQVLPLNGAHNVSKEALDKGVSFIDMMRKNLENLRVGLECK